jgi:hypothetical protein|tara:strand:+ start:1498 stop:1839 length:342 start_codon:yes stop_codon:yes gene_type:complete
MWKLINCGTYFWYIRTDRKYHHCYKPYGNKSIKIRIGRASPTVLQRFDINYLHTWLRSSDDGKTTLECYIPRMTMKNRKKEIERLQENTLTKKVRAIIETIKKTRRYEKDSKS